MSETAAETAPSPDAAPARGAEPSARRRATRDRLIEAAAEIFMSDGLQGASVEAISQRAGFTRGAFYSNFTSKEELFLAALARQYAERAERLEAHTSELVPMVRDRAGAIAPSEVACIIDEFFAPTGAEPIWFALEAEFMLLAMRDPSIAPGFTGFIERFHRQLAQLVEPLIGVAGRRFTIPADRAITVLGGVYERALSITAIAGRSAPEGIDELGERVAELLFAITEPLPEAVA